MRVETITSAQNPKIKNLLLLQEKSKARREQGLFVVEGRRELEWRAAASWSTAWKRDSMYGRCSCVRK